MTAPVGQRPNAAARVERERIRERYGDRVTNCYPVRFRDSRGRLGANKTPVMPIEGLLEYVMLLTGAKAANIRRAVVDVFADRPDRPDRPEPRTRFPRLWPWSWATLFLFRRCSFRSPQRPSVGRGPFRQPHEQPEFQGLGSSHARVVLSISGDRPAD